MYIVTGCCWVQLRRGGRPFAIAGYVVWVKGQAVGSCLQVFSFHPSLGSVVIIIIDFLIFSHTEIQTRSTLETLNGY